MDSPTACSRETDQLPIAELVDRLALSPVGDVARGPDGAVYYISSASAASSTIGRRAVCGPFDNTWLTIPAPITDLEVSRNNELFLAGSPKSTSSLDDVARLYVLDLATSGAIPKTIFETPYKQISSLSAAGDARVFYLIGDRNGVKTLEYRGSAGEFLAMGTPLAVYVSVVGLGDGNAFVSWGNGSNSSASRASHLVFDAQGHATFHSSNTGFYNPPILGAGDSSGGLYVSVAGSRDNRTTYSLVPVSSISLPALVANALVEVSTTDFTNYLAVFGVDGNPSHALLLTPGDPIKYTEVSLPVPTL